MLDGIFYNPTKIIFGKTSLDYLSNEVLKYTSNSILLVYGKNSCKQIGLYDKILEQLKDKFTIFELFDIQSNPTLEKVNEGIEICKNNNIKFILAVGGGSVIDTAKMIILKYDNTIKLGTILTIPGSGSESSPHAIIMDTEKKEKLSYTDNCMLPVFSILNPEYTLSLNKEQTACGILDAITHVLERYYTNTENVECSNSLCLSLFRSLSLFYKNIFNNLNDYNLRAEIMWACKLAHDNTVGFGRKADWSSHFISYEINALYPRISHGNLVYILFLAWLNYTSKKNDRHVYILNNFCYLINLLKEMPFLYLNLKEIDVDMKYKFKDIALKSCSRTKSGTLGNYVRLTNIDIENILNTAYEGFYL